jgi:hypothetical protein
MLIDNYFFCGLIHHPKLCYIHENTPNKPDPCSANPHFMNSHAPGREPVRSFLNSFCSYLHNEIAEISMRRAPISASTFRRSIHTMYHSLSLEYVIPKVDRSYDSTSAFWDFASLARSVHNGRSPRRQIWGLSYRFPSL